MDKKQIFQIINNGGGTHIGSCRPTPKRQLDLWKVGETNFLITSRDIMRNDATLKGNPNYEHEQLDLQTEIL